jgi:hypothetical protein
MTCQHKRYSVDVHEQTGQCIDCGAEGRISFVVPEEIEHLQAIEAAARNLVKVKGRYHTEQAFKTLAALLVNTNSGTPTVA